MPSVLVTGANRGIGLATSLSLARAGHRVVAGVRDASRADQLRAAADSEDLPISVCALDVNSDDSVRNSIAQVLEDVGPLDALVNNAGIERHGSIEELPLSEFRAVMETNYFGVIRCIQAVLPTMRARGSGCIVNVSSVAGRIASSPLGPYTASKFALEALSEVLAQEVKQFGVRVAVVEPGVIDTDMAHDIEEVEASPYPHARRMAALFRESLKTPTGPDVVAATIRDIIESDSWQLRYPAGPQAGPYLAWRSAMTDEDWIDRSASGDEAWVEAMQRDFGMDLHL